MGSLGGPDLKTHLIVLRKGLKLGVPRLDAGCTVGLNSLSVARNPDKPTQNKLKNETHNLLTEWLERNFSYLSIILLLDFSQILNINEITVHLIFQLI